MDAISNLSNMELEQAVFSCVLINPESWREMAIRPADFSINSHVWIATAIEKLIKSGDAVDILTISHQLETADKLAEVGGAAYLTRLINATERGSSLNGVTYANRIKDLSTRRRIINALEKIAQITQEIKTPLESVTSEARIILDDALNNSALQPGRSMLDALREFDAMIEIRKNADFSILGIPTGYTDIDDKLDGFQNGWLYLIAARPGSGKTAMLGNLAINAAKHGKKVLFFSAEMDSQRILARMVAAESKINTTILKHGAIETQEDWQRYNQTVETFEGLPIRFYGPDECRKVEQIESITRQLYARGEVDIIFVDYLQLLQTESSSRMATREQEVTKIAQTLKRITNIQIPVIAAAQLSRAAEQRGADSRPQLSDLRESGSLEQEADSVCFLYHPQDDIDSSLEFIVSKNRDGVVGACPLYYDKTTQKIKTGVRDSVKLNPDRKNSKMTA